MTKKFLTLENIRSGAVPSDAVAVGFLLGELEKLRTQMEILQRANRFLSEQIPSALEPRAVDPNGPPHELRPLLENAVKALDMGVAISPGSYVHDELKLLLSQGASRDASSPSPQRPSPPPATSRYCVVCDRIKDDSGETLGWALCECGSFRQPATTSRT